MKLAESMRVKHTSPGKKENIMKKMNNSRSRSPKGFHQSFMNDFAERETMKVAQNSD